MARRVILKPEDAKTEGVRRLRELLKRQTYGAIARRLRVDESTVRLIAQERRTPGPIIRERWREEFGYDPDVWDESPARDAYTTDPATTKKAPR